MAQEQSLPFALGARTATDQARRQHARVVEHQQIAGFEQRGQVAEPLMTPHVSPSPNHQQTRLVALGARILSDEVRRQLVVQLVDADSFLPQ